MAAYRAYINKKITAEGGGDISRVEDFDYDGDINSATDYADSAIVNASEEELGQVVEIERYEGFGEV